MQRVLWWSVLGICGAGLAGLWLGQAVLGQPQYVPVAPQPPPASNVLPPAGSSVPSAGGPKSGGEVPRPLDFPAGRFADAMPGPIAPVPAGAILPVAAPPPTASYAKPSVPTSAAPLDVHPGRQSPSLSIEWIGPATIRTHQPMSCQILVRNTSHVALQNVVVRHRLGDGVTCKASEPQVNNEGGELAWNLGVLAPEQARRIDLVLVAPARGVLNCRATATFTATAGLQVQVREPQLTFKMRAPEKVIAGEKVDFMCEIANPGDGVAEAIKLRTTLPDGLEHSSGRKVLEFELGNLAPKESRKVQLPCVAKGSGLQHCKIVVVGDGNLTAQDSAQFEILTARLDVVVSGPRLRYLDRHAVYVLKVTNPGSAPAAGVEVQEVIPAGFRFHQATGGGQFHEAEHLVSWNVGDLQPGQSKDVAVDLVPIQPGEHRLIANAKSARGLKSEGQTLTVVEGLPSLFIEVAHVDDPIEIGAETAFEIRVANIGTKTETNVEVACVLPEQLEFKGAECKSAVKYRLENRELIFEPLPRLSPKADVIYRVKVRGIAAGDVRFRTRIRADSVRDALLRDDSLRVYSDGALPRQPATSGAAPGVSTMPGSVPATLPIMVQSSAVPTAPLPAPSMEPVTPPLPLPAPLP